MDYILQPQISKLFLDEYMYRLIIDNQTERFGKIILVYITGSFETLFNLDFIELY